MRYPGHRKARISLGALALMLGCVAEYLGNKILGVRIEIFYGLETFNFIWFLQLFILPMMVGVLVSYIFGFGGKWLAHFPPLIVLGAQYLETAYLIGVNNPDLMPLGWWAFYVILAIECCAAGGVMGEIWFKAYYKESSPEVKRVQPK